MRSFFCLLVAFFAVMVTACDGGGGCDTPKTIALTEADNGGSVEMNLIDQIKVILPSNPTTGFEWENVLSESSIIVQAGDSVYTMNPACNNRPGCGGTETFTFKAVKKGQGGIKLIYHQSFSDDEPSKVFEATVTVN